MPNYRMHTSFAGSASVALEGRERSDGPNSTFIALRLNAQFAQSQRKRNGLRTIPKERRFCTESVPFPDLRCNALWDVRITLRYARTCWKGESGNQRFQPNARSKHARLSSTTHEREDQSLYPFSLTISLKACAFSSYSTSSLLRSPQIASLSSRTCFWRR